MIKNVFKSDFEYDKMIFNISKIISKHGLKCQLKKGETS